eukprot:6243163-Karenia_brevis.AAC.1
MTLSSGAVTVVGTRPKRNSSKLIRGIALGGGAHELAEEYPGRNLSSLYMEPAGKTLRRQLLTISGRVGRRISSRNGRRNWDLKLAVRSRKSKTHCNFQR